MTTRYRVECEEPQLLRIFSSQLPFADLLQMLSRYGFLCVLLRHPGRLQTPSASTRLICLLHDSHTVVTSW